jgi:hypothetical protein
MIPLLWLLLAILTSSFKPRCQLEAENAALRHQVIVLRRQLRGRIHVTNLDRLFLVQLYRWFPSILGVLAIIQPETFVRWHRAGFRYYWRWKSRARGGRPVIANDLRALIRQMSIDNPLWGAPCIHGELLKLGFEVAQSTVARYRMDGGLIRWLVLVFFEPSRGTLATVEIEQDRISRQSGIARSGGGSTPSGAPALAESGPGRSTVCS